MYILRIFSKLQIFLLPSDWNDNILSEITIANAFVLAATISVKLAFI